MDILWIQTADKERGRVKGKAVGCPWITSKSRPPHVIRAWNTPRVIASGSCHSWLETVVDAALFLQASWVLPYGHLVLLDMWLAPSKAPIHLGPSRGPVLVDSSHVGSEPASWGFMMSRPWFSTLAEHHDHLGNCEKCQCLGLTSDQLK